MKIYCTFCKRDLTEIEPYYHDLCDSANPRQDYIELYEFECPDCENFTMIHSEFFNKETKKWELNILNMIG